MQLGYFKVKEVASLRPILTPPWIHPWADMTENQQHFSGTMNTSSLPRFTKIHQAVLDKNGRKCKFLTDDKRNDSQKDGRTDDGLKTYDGLCRSALELLLYVH